MNIAELESKTLADLQDIARSMGVTGYTRLKKYDLVMRLLKAETEAQGLIFGGGTLEVIQDGIGFLRSNKQMNPGPDDVYISQSQIRRFGLRTGDSVIGQVRPPKESEKYFGLLKVEAVNGIDPEVAKRRPKFEDLTPIFPNQLLALETQPAILTTRLIDMVAPIGRGQRGSDRVAPQGRQNHRAQADRQRHLGELSRSGPDGAPHRRAAGRSHRHGSCCGGRSAGLDLRRAGAIARACG